MRPMKGSSYLRSDLLQFSVHDTFFHKHSTPLVTILMVWYYLNYTLYIITAINTIIPVSTVRIFTGFSSTSLKPLTWFRLCRCPINNLHTCRLMGRGLLDVAELRLRQNQTSWLRKSGYYRWQPLMKMLIAWQQLSWGLNFLASTLYRKLPLPPSHPLDQRD